MNKHVIVLGCGVTGLQTALSLLRASYRVTIIAEHIPGDTHAYYTSPWAGAQWRTHATAADTESCQWDIETYNDWMETVKREESEGRRGDSGLGVYTSIVYWASKTSEIEDGVSSLWWQSLVSNFTVIPTTELPHGIQYGISFTTITVDVPRNLEYLFNCVLSLGGKIIKASMPLNQDLPLVLKTAAALVETKVDAYVNATGLGAKSLVGDDDVYPTRGQTVLVRGEARYVTTRLGKDEGDISYVIPRSGITVLGGTKEAGIWDTRANDRTTASILERCKRLAPELLDSSGEFEVLGVQVGLRPSRKGGARVEVESVGGRDIVVHSYGHSGAGYQNSVGSANKVVRLLQGQEHTQNLISPAKL